MRKLLTKIGALFLMGLSIILFASCKDKVMGYSVLLWDMPEHKIQSGSVLPVYIRSNISHVYVAGIADEDFRW